MIPGIDTGGGGFSGSSAAGSESSGSIGASSSTFGGGLFNKSGIEFGNKGVSPYAIAGSLAAIAAGLYFYYKKG